jgi:hypothetical protein
MSSKELEDLYKNSNIDLCQIKEISESNETFYFQIVKEVVKKKINNTFTTTEFNYTMKPVSVAGLEENDIQSELNAKNLFKKQDAAKDHIKYLSALDGLIKAAVGVNIADNNYKPNFRDEESRIYVVTYNERNQSVAYDYVYTIMIAYTDYRLAFRTQQIVENFISAFREDLKFVNQYRVSDLLNGYID